VIDERGAPIAGAWIGVVAGGRELERVEVDEAGAFAVRVPRPDPRGPDGRPIELVARAPGRGAVCLGDVEPVVVLFPEARIEGAVIEADGAPIVGAVVSASQPPNRTATGADGRFVLAGLAPGRVSIEARLPGASSWPTATVAVGPGETSRDLLLAAEPFRRIAGVVVDADSSQPVAGARLSGVIAGADGSFVLERASTETFALWVADLDVEGGPGTWIEAGAEPVGDVVIRVRRRPRVAGRVLDRCGDAVAGAVVMALRWVDRGLADYNRRRPPRAISGTDGDFVLADLHPGGHVLEAFDPDGGGRSRLVEVEVGEADAGGAPVELRLERGGEIAGVITSATGDPVAGLPVGLSGSSLDDLSQIRRPHFLVDKEILPHRARTDAGGRFRLRGLGAGRYRLAPGTAFAPERSSPSWCRLAGAEALEAIELDSDETRIELDLVLGDRLDRTVAGTVVDPSGDPIAGASVYASADLVSVASVTADIDGRFALAGLPDATIHVSAHGPVSGAARLEVGAGNSGELTLVLEPTSGAIEGTVSGAPDPVRVVVYSDFASASYTYVETEEHATSRGGRFRLEGLLAGDYVVRARSAGREGYARARIVAGETARVAIALTDPVPLALQVRRFPGGAPAGAGIRCRLRAARPYLPERAAHATTGADGIARFPRPPRATVFVDGEGDGLWSYAALFIDSDRGAAELFVTDTGGPSDPERLGAQLAAESEWPPEASRGLRVEEVAPGSPAAVAGLELGDLIVAVTGDTTAGARLYAAAIQLHHASGRIPLTVLREGEELELAIELPAGE
jgi:hypothetical protein